MENLFAIVKRDGLQGLNADQLDFFAIYWFVIETTNGGLDAFFFNDSGQLAAPALRCLEKIGAARTAEVLRRAISIFPDSHVPTDQAERREMLESLEDHEQSIGSFTSELFACKEDVAALHKEFVAQHPDVLERLRKT